MGTIPLLRPKEVVKAFERLGWSANRQRGSHIIMTKPGYIATLSIPDHAFVARGTLRSLLARAGISLEEFLNSLT
jgi:predicted RNA binding protein YcfA (HicA-like mRNA interferase family)